VVLFTCAVTIVRHMGFVCRIMIVFRRNSCLRHRMLLSGPGVGFLRTPRDFAEMHFVHSASIWPHLDSALTVCEGPLYLPSCVAPLAVAESDRPSGFCIRSLRRPGPKYRPRASPRSPDLPISHYSKTLLEGSLISSSHARASAPHSYRDMNRQIPTGIHLLNGAEYLQIACAGPFVNSTSTWTNSRAAYWRWGFAKVHRVAMSGLSISFSSHLRPVEGDRVGVFMLNSSSYAALQWATAKVGGTTAGIQTFQSDDSPGLWTLRSAPSSCVSTPRFV
jgi:hypothetical protein